MKIAGHQKKKKKERERDIPCTNTHMLHGMQPTLLPLSLSLSLSLCLSLSTREWLTLLLLRLARSGWCLDLLAVLALLLGQVGVCIVVAQARTVLVALPTDWHTHTRSYKSVTVKAAHTKYRPKRPTAGFVTFEKRIFTWLIFDWRASSKLIQRR